MKTCLKVHSSIGYIKLVKTYNNNDPVDQDTLGVNNEKFLRGNFDLELGGQRALDFPYAFGR
jgi:hypothetical protein